MSEDLNCTPPEIRAAALQVVTKLLPAKSKPAYDKEYMIFNSWCEQNAVENPTENVLLVYFEKMSTSKKSSTLWSSYSKLRTCLNVYQNIDISKFGKLQAFLKRQSSGYQPKKSKILGPEDIERFLTEADDSVYLAMKVVLIMGYAGACRREELTMMGIDDVEFKKDTIHVKIPKTKTNISRLFIITEQNWIGMIKKYQNLRPTDLKIKRFFLTYRNGRCTKSPIGINKIGQMPKLIATFLKLDNPEQFTGHCFRRSSASHLANQGGDLITIKQHGGWKSSAVAEGYIDASLKKKVEVADLLKTTLPQPSQPSTSGFDSMADTSYNHIENDNVSTDVQGASTYKKNIFTQVMPGVSINAHDTCAVTVNVYKNCTITSSDLN